MVEQIRWGNKIVARIIGAEELTGPFKFFTEDEDNLQVSRWNHPKGYKCKPHFHNPIPRAIEMVNEVIIVLEGEVMVTIYSPENKPFTQRVLRKLDVFHAIECGHGYDVLTDDTCVLEVKNGPFMGDDNYDQERTLIEETKEYNRWDQDAK